MCLSSDLALHETHLKYSKFFKVTAINSGIYVVPFGATMCCRNLSSLFSADGREGGVFASFFGNTSLEEMFVLVCAWDSQTVQLTMFLQGLKCLEML